jgi:hypothetical protein
MDNRISLLKSLPPDTPVGRFQLGGLIHTIESGADLSSIRDELAQTANVYGGDVLGYSNTTAMAVVGLIVVILGAAGLYKNKVPAEWSAEEWAKWDAKWDADWDAAIAEGMAEGRAEWNAHNAKGKAKWKASEMERIKKRNRENAEIERNREMKRPEIATWDGVWRRKNVDVVGGGQHVLSWLLAVVILLIICICICVSYRQKNRVPTRRVDAPACGSFGPGF